MSTSMSYALLYIYAPCYDLTVNMFPCVPLVCGWEIPHHRCCI